MSHTVTGRSPRQAARSTSSRPCARRSASRIPSGAGTATSTPTRCWPPVYTELVARSGIEPALVEDLVIGCTAPFGEQSRNIARNAWLQAGYPAEVPATTLDRRCGSAQTAVEMACGAGRLGHSRRRDRRRRRAHGPRPDQLPRQDLRAVRRSLAARAARPLRLRAPGRKRRADRRPLGASAARRWTRSPCGRTRTGRQGHRRRQVRRRDGPDRRSTARSATPTSASAPEPPWRRWPSSSRCSARRTGGSPPGRSSPICDGAAGGAARAPEDAARRLGLRPRARIVDQTTVGVDPIIMLTGPIPATRKLLERNGLDDRRHRPVRGQRGVHLGRAGLAARAEARHGPRQRQRRRDRARPPGRRHRRPADRHPARRDGTPRRRARAGDHVLRRRARARHADPAGTTA